MASADTMVESVVGKTDASLDHDRVREEGLFDLQLANGSVTRSQEVSPSSSSGPAETLGAQGATSPLYVEKTEALGAGSDRSAQSSEPAGRSGSDGLQMPLERRPSGVGLERV